MPSVRRRLALTLPADVELALFDLADALGKPATKVVTELLQEMVPQLQGLAKITRAGRAGNKAEAKRALQHMLGDSMAELLSHEQPDMFGKPKRKKSA